jgi:hypothetical protein
MALSGVRQLLLANAARPLSLNRLVPYDLGEDCDAIAVGVVERHPHAVIFGAYVEATHEQLVQSLRVGQREGKQLHAVRGGRRVEVRPAEYLASTLDLVVAPETKIGRKTESYAAEETLAWKTLADEHAKGRVASRALVPCFSEVAIIGRGKPPLPVALPIAVPSF